MIEGYIVFYLIVALVSVLGLYYIIRIAVRHGIQDARKVPAGTTASPSASHRDADGL